MKLPNQGSKWTSGQGDTFRVIQLVEVEEHTWIHYIKNNAEQEYSCYVESFLERFREIPE
jgi:hypothetical protein